VFGFGPSEFIGVAPEDIDRNSKIQKLNLPSKAVWISAGYHHSLAVTGMRPLSFLFPFTRNTEMRMKIKEKSSRLGQILREAYKHLKLAVH